MFKLFKSKKHIGPEYVIKEEFEHDRIRYQVYFNKEVNGIRIGAFYKAPIKFSSYNYEELKDYTEDFLWDLYMDTKF